MPRGMLIAGCLLLVSGACRHPDGADSDSNSLTRSSSSSPADLEIPEVLPKQAWGQGGKSLTVHRSSSCPSNSIEESGCGNETSYRFVRATRLLKLSACSCGNERSEEKEMTLSPAQAREIDQLMNSLDPVAGVAGPCSEASEASSLWELIVENAESVESSYPVATCGSKEKQAGKINARPYQTLFEYLKRTLPL